jgi:hypothetical protein
MSPQDYHTLRRYAMKYANDADDQNELVLMAWQESNRLGHKSCIPILVNYMKLRGRNHDRSIVGAKFGGKSIRDIWNRSTRMPPEMLVDDEHSNLLECIGSLESNPFGMCVVQGYRDALSGAESRVAEQMVAGYTEKEGAKRARMEVPEFRRVKEVVRKKAMEHLA